MGTCTPGSALSTGLPPPDMRALFPALATSEVYLDSAATTQKPLPVLATLIDHHRRVAANAGRGSYSRSSRLATRIAEIRARTARFVGAAGADEIVFTSGATAALNAVALCWALPELRDGDRILFNPLDHASNVLPWHHLRALLARFGRRIELVPYRTTAQGGLCLERDMVTNHRVSLPGLPRPGDLIVFPNTAAYHTDLSAASASMRPPPPKLAVVRAAHGFRIVPDAQTKREDLGRAVPEES